MRPVILPNSMKETQFGGTVCILEAVYTTFQSIELSRLVKVLALICFLNTKELCHKAGLVQAILSFGSNNLTHPGFYF